MISIPELYKKDCELVTTTYGKFLHKYNQHHRTKTSRIQGILVEKGQQYLSTMSKYDFLKEYILNKEFNFSDFMNISTTYVSFKGFLFETLWDICFKCNVIEQYDNSQVDHYSGKIEELRNLKELQDLKSIENLYEYLTINKVQSGNSAGISDITMRYKDLRSEKTKSPCKPVVSDTSHKYVFVSSKYYLNEKSVSKYDIASIIQAVKGTSIDYEIVLVINNRRLLEKNIERSLKKHTIDKIAKIYDRYDLEIAFNKLRLLFKHLKEIHPHKTFDEVFLKFFSSQKEWKPLLPQRFDTCLFIDHSHIMKCHKWYSFDRKGIVLSILNYLSQISDGCMIITSDSVIKKQLMKYFKKYHCPTQHQVVITDDIDKNYPDIKHVFIDVSSIGKSIVNKANKKYSHVIQFSHERTSSISYDIEWNVKDALSLKYGRYDPLNSQWKQCVVENSIFRLFGEEELENNDIISSDKVWKAIANSYDKYPQIYVFSNDFTSKSQSFKTYSHLFGVDLPDDVIGKNMKEIADLLFGNHENFLENYIYANRLPSENRFHSTLIMVSKIKHRREILQYLKANPIVSKRNHILMDNESISDYNKHLIMVSGKFIDLPCLRNIIIISDPAKPKVMLDAVSTMFQNTIFDNINIVSFQKGMVNLLKEFLGTDGVYYS